MKKVLLKRVPRAIDKTQQSELMSKWGTDMYIKKQPQKKIELKSSKSNA